MPAPRDLINVVNNFGFLEHISASLEMFEEMSRGRARTETIIQQMKDGDAILCYGREAARAIEFRLKERGLHNCRVPHFGEADFVNMSLDRLSATVRNICPGTVWLDHTFILAFVKAEIVHANHRFAQVVGIIGERNARQKDGISGNDFSYHHPPKPLD